MGEFRQNTWAAGLERLLLGVTMDETDQHFIGTTLPLDDVDAGDVDLVGRLAELVTRVKMLITACNRPQSVAAWVDLFKHAIELLAAVPPGDAWQLSHAYRELGDLGLSSDEADDVLLDLADVSELLSDAFRGRPSRANFRTGTLTVCTMLPMRSVPHRVVCVLGVDDGVFLDVRNPMATTSSETTSGSVITTYEAKIANCCWTRSCRLESGWW